MRSIRLSMVTKLTMIPMGVKYMWYCIGMLTHTMGLGGHVKGVRADIYYYKYKKQLNKIEDEGGMAVPKSTQTKFNFVGTTYHIHYTSLRLLFSIISCTSDSACKASLHFDIDSMHVGHPWVVSIDCLFLHVPHMHVTATKKASVGMYSGCDTLSLQN